MSEGLTCWFGDAVKKSAELILNKISNILPVQSDIVVNDLSDHHTKCTLVLEATSQSLVLFFQGRK